MIPEALFALVATAAYSVLLDGWRFKQSGLAHVWGTFGTSTSLPPRAGFTGVVRGTRDTSLHPAPTLHSLSLFEVCDCSRRFELSSPYLSYLTLLTHCFCLQVIKNPVTGRFELDFPDTLRAPRRRFATFASSTVRPG